MESGSSSLPENEGSVRNPGPATGRHGQVDMLGDALLDETIKAFEFFVEKIVRRGPVDLLMETWGLLHRIMAPDRPP